MVKRLLIFCAIVAVAFANGELRRNPRQVQYNPQLGNYYPVRYGYRQPLQQEASAGAQAVANIIPMNQGIPINQGLPFNQLGGNPVSGQAMAQAQATVGNNPQLGVFPQNNIGSYANSNAGTMINPQYQLY